MKVLGIDPGSIKTGWAILEKDGKKILRVASGVIRVPQSQAVEKPAHYFQEIQKIIALYQPQEAALESLIYVKSPTSLIKLAQVRGAICAALGISQNIKMTEYSPNEIKGIVTGHGHATKEGIQKSLDMILGRYDYESDDESDATAVALCHCLGRGQSLIKKSKQSLGTSLIHAIKGPRI